MTMLDWAKREIEMAKKIEKKDLKKGEFDYGGACYDSALKAFKSLAKDGHSGFSIHLTKDILNRLIDGKPLTPIEDTEDIWNDISYVNEENGFTQYQCKRMSSLFKHVYNDGRIEYSDIYSHYCLDLETDTTYHSGLVRDIIDEMFPITMPYMPPNKPMSVGCRDFLTDVKNGDFDTIGVLYVIKQDGTKIDINRYFKEGEDGWIEIGLDEYNERYNVRIKGE